MNVRTVWLFHVFTVLFLIVTHIETIMTEGQYISTDNFRDFHFLWIIFLSEILCFIFSPQYL